MSTLLWLDVISSILTLICVFLMVLRDPPRPKDAGRFTIELELLSRMLTDTHRSAKRDSARWQVVAELEQLILDHPHASPVDRHRARVGLAEAQARLRHNHRSGRR